MLEKGQFVTFVVLAKTCTHTILSPWTQYKGGSVSGDVVDHRQLGEPGGGANHVGFVEMDSHCDLVGQSGCFPQETCTPILICPDRPDTKPNHHHTMPITPMNAASVVAVPDQTHPIVVMLTIGKKGYIYVANSCNKLLYVHGSPDIQANLHHCVHTIPTHVFKQQGWGNSAILVCNGHSK